MLLVVLKNVMLEDIKTRKATVVLSNLFENQNDSMDTSNISHISKSTASSRRSSVINFSSQFSIEQINEILDL